MHATLHLTSNCNMQCSYCYSPPQRGHEMSSDVIKKAVAYAGSLSPQNTGIIFFGGEPLLKDNLIKIAIKECKKIEEELGYSYHYKMSTNGLALRKQFLEYANEVDLCISLSIDGNENVHNLHRRGANGKQTFTTIVENAKTLLKYQPYAEALVVITPETVKYYLETVEFLLDLGFKYLIISLNYAGNWNDLKLNELKKQYKKIAALYKKLIKDEEKFYISPIDAKIASYIKDDYSECYRCALGQKQVSIAPDGSIFPCVQFVKYNENYSQYKIGDVWQGIDETARARLYKQSQVNNDICNDCAIKKRCNNNCSCLNIQTTGYINKVAPILCESERILIPIVDELGNTLFKNRTPMFIQKHYNSQYPVLSYIEDQN